MNQFIMNGYVWHVKFVPSNNPFLVDRTRTYRVATTDPDTMCVYLSDKLHGDFLIRVLIHELGHCAMFSFNLLYDIHRFVYPEYWIDAEEWVCNFIADYGLKIFKNAYSILGYRAWKSVPYEIEKMISA